MNDEKVVNQSLKQAVDLKGVIVPTDWDEIGNFTAVALAADDEKEYRISADNKVGRQLHQMLRLRVKIEGHIHTDYSGGKMVVITVNSFQILDEIQ